MQLHHDIGLTWHSQFWQWLILSYPLKHEVVKTALNKLEPAVKADINHNLSRRKPAIHSPGSTIVWPSLQALDAFELRINSANLGLVFGNPV